MRKKQYLYLRVCLRFSYWLQKQIPLQNIIFFSYSAVWTECHKLYRPPTSRNIYTILCLLAIKQPEYVGCWFKTSYLMVKRNQLSVIYYTTTYTFIYAWFRIHMGRFPPEREFWLFCLILEKCKKALWRHFTF